MLNTLVHNMSIHKGSQSVLFVRTDVCIYAYEGTPCVQINKDMNYWIYDVAPRLGGGTNVHVNVGHPYGNALWRKPMSSGRRIAMELRMAAEQDRLLEVLT